MKQKKRNNILSMSNHRKEGNVQCQKCNSDNGSTGLARSYVISRSKVCGRGGGSRGVTVTLLCRSVVLAITDGDLHANCSAPTSVFQFPLFSLRKSEPSVSKSIQQFYFNIIINQLCFKFIIIGLLQSNYILLKCS